MPSVLVISRRKLLYALGVLAAAGLTGSLYLALTSPATEPYASQFQWRLVAQGE